MKSLKQFFESNLGEVIVGCIAIAWGLTQLVDLAATKFAGL